MTPREVGSKKSVEKNVSLSERQRLLLGLLEALGGSVDNLDFQKVLFLYCQKSESSQPYEFVPYKRGAFSFTCYADRRKLISSGFVVDSDLSWELTNQGSKSTEADIFLRNFVESLGGLRGDDLIADTYRRFPYYAIRSEITMRVLEGDEEALTRIETEKARVDPHPLLTIGYEGRSLEGYLNLLVKADVKVLCDVRRNPISRKYGFSKSTLGNACAGIGIWYEHLPELGIASEHRQDLKSQEDYDTLFKEYKRDHLPHQTEALQKIQEWMKSGAGIALTCFEHLPHQCHRHCVAEQIQALSPNQFSVRHL